MGLHTVQRLGLGPKDDLVCLGWLLPVIDPLLQRTVIPLRRIQHHLGIFRFILVPAVMQGFAHPRQLHGRNQLYFKSGIQ